MSTRLLHVIQIVVKFFNFFNKHTRLNSTYISYKKIKKIVYGYAQLNLFFLQHVEIKFDFVCLPSDIIYYTLIYLV